MTETTMRRLLLDIVLRRKPRPLTEAETKMRAALVRDVERIEKAGGIVEAPFDIPGQD